MTPSCSAIGCIRRASTALTGWPHVKNQNQNKRKVHSTVDAARAPVISTGTGGCSRCLLAVSIIASPQPQSLPPSGQHLPRIPPPFLHNHPHLAAPPRPPRQKLNHPQPPPATPPPLPPLQRHVLILLGRCLQLRRKQAAADAARHCSRQLRSDGETGRRARCVCCTWLMTLLLRRLPRIA